MTIQGIRGFNKQRVIEFSPELTLVYGKNGSGKTSLGEALEWLFYGKTAKRQRGDNISKREYKDTYRNVNYAEDETPFVELKVELEKGDILALRRDLHEDESSAASVDGVECADFSAVGVVSEFDRPMLLQHTLNDFIYMQPKTRYRALSSILGLESLIEFRDHVDTLQGTGGYTKDKPQCAKEARQFLSDLRRRAGAHPTAARLLEHLAAGANGLAAARTALRELINASLHRDVPENTLPDALAREKTLKEKSVLDWAKYGVRHPLNQALETAKATCDTEVACATEIVGKMMELPSDKKLQRTRLLRRFYETGLTIHQDEEAQHCPFCGEKTLTDKRIAEMRQELETPTGDDTERTDLSREYEAFFLRMRPAMVTETGIIPTLPDAVALAKLREMLAADAAHRLKAYDLATIALSARSLAVAQARENVTEALEDLKTRIQGNIPDEDVSEELPQRLKAYAQELTKARTETLGYGICHANLDAAVEKSISTDEVVAYLDFLQTAWDEWSSIELAVYDAESEDSILQFRRLVMSFIQNKQTEVLNTRNDDIKAWYDVLNPKEPVTFSHVRVVPDDLRLMAEAYGKEMAAAPNLSCSHLNCLGLSVHLACATRAGSPFQFVFIDDPVQSMDDDHSEAFKIQVIEKLLQQERQLVVLTHLENFAHGVDTRHRHHCELYRLNFLGHTKEGPTVEVFLPHLMDLLRVARNHMDAHNEAYRVISVNYLRRFVERFVKDLYVRQTGDSISRRYQNETWPRLKRLLLHCKDFDPADESRLQDTHIFTSQHMHEDDTAPQPVPKPHQIRAHVDDMEKLSDKYAASLGLKT